MANDFIMLDGSSDSNSGEQAQSTYTPQGNYTSMGNGTQGQYNRYYQMGQGGPSMNKPPHGKKNKGSGLGKKVVALVAGGLVFGLVAGVAFQGVNLAGNYLFGEEPSNQQVGTVSMTPVEDQSETKKDSSKDTKNTVVPVGTATVADVAKNTMPSVVAITSISVQEIPSYNFWGWGWGGETQEYEGESSGSGIIVGENETELLIATNNHVVEGAKTLTVCFLDEDKSQKAEGTETEGNAGAESQGEADAGSAVGRMVPNGESQDEADAENAVAAEIKGTDAENDLAVIAVKKADIPQDILSQIKIAQLGNSDELVVGEQVVAIGNALGFGQSVTSGYVSALDRYIDDMTTPCIQTDAAINPGNSGGALLNMSGQVIGINSAKLAENSVEGMGYAIPISTAMPILDDLMTREKVDESKASYLGISCKEVTAELSQYGVPEGVFVAEITENGPAAKAGILPNDIITSLGGTKVSTPDELTGQLEYHAAGENVEVVIQRVEGGQYQEHKITVELGNRKDMKS